MLGQAPQSPRWNLFARELEEILAAHDLRLGQLDDRSGVHREKVRRLRQSLGAPTSFPTLNPDEMDRVIATCALTDDEVLRLRAAILATAVEALLMDRIHPRDALSAAEQLLPVITGTLRSYAHSPIGIGALRSGTIDAEEHPDETDIDRALAKAVDSIDRATLDLHLSRNVTSVTERVARVYSARDGFARALYALQNVSAAIQHTPAWQEWYQEAQSGYNQSLQRMADLDL